MGSASASYGHSQTGDGIGASGGAEPGAASVAGVLSRLGEDLGVLAEDVVDAGEVHEELHDRGGAGLVVERRVIEEIEERPREFVEEERA